MSLGDPDPSPERDPKQSGLTPKKPCLEVRTLDPIATELQVENIDRLTDILHLCGLAPNDASIQYLWKTLINDQIPNLETLNDHQGALGLSLELQCATKHELEWRGDALPERCTCDEYISITLSTRHREGSELNRLENLSEGNPALDGLVVEIVATPLGDAPALARIFWNEESLARGSAGERWELIRGFYYHFRGIEIPDSLPLAPGQQQKFHYLTVELEPMLIKVQRRSSETSDGTPQREAGAATPHLTRPFELVLRNPPLSLLQTLVTASGALQLQGPWFDETSHHKILTHLRDCAISLRKLDLDELMMCTFANPCVVFSREEICEGEDFPPHLSSKVTMTDYTCRGGALQMEFRTTQDQEEVDVHCVWENSTPRHTETNWKHISELAEPYIFESGND